MPPIELLVELGVRGSRWRTRKQLRAQLVAERTMLRRVARAVVGGEPPERIYALFAAEVAAVLRAGASAIMRLEEPRTSTVTGSWSDRVDWRYVPGTEVAITPGGDLEAALRAGRSVRGERRLRNRRERRGYYRSSLVAPILVGEAVWGLFAVAAAAPGRFTADDEQRLMQFGQLLATAIAGTEDRAKLAAQASSDPLTGLANHRAIHRRLCTELARSARHGTPLSVAMIDIDHFKQINDSGGHEVGDEMLVRVADTLTRLARTEDTLGRAGGDEFAWILPETTREQALVAVERARRVIAATMPAPYRITVSAGICDTTVTRDPGQLIHLADGALYWSKAHGRNQCWIYDPSVIDEVSAQERAERLERSKTLVGLRALARAIDAKDPATHRHSERVSELAGKLARAVGWPRERAALLSEAALVHDVGKIGVPDRLLRKPALLTDAEREQIKVHAELAARIVEDVLAPEQVEWIRTHHERPDGAGYPRGLRGAQISEGAALLAVADAWDVMTASRPHSIPKTPDAALAECIELVGHQFTKTAVAALVRLHRAGHVVREQLDLEAVA